MLQLQLEVRTIQFFINSMTESCLMQFIHNQSSIILKSKLKCKCRDIQVINEKIDLNIQYLEKGNLKLLFQDGQIILGEATINLGFYIENSLPVIIDNITIQSKYDQEAYVELSLGWNKLEQIQTQEIESINPEREQPLFIKLSQQSPNRVQNLKFGDKLENLKMKDSIVAENYFKEFKQEQFDKKSIENDKVQQIEDEKLEDIHKVHIQTTNSLRFQTPKDCKFTKKQKIQTSSGHLENCKKQVNKKQLQSDSKPTFKELGQKIRQKSTNRFESRVKIRIENQQAEQNETVKRATKQRFFCKQTEDIGKQVQKYQEAGFFTSRQLELEKGNQDQSIQELHIENKLLKNQIQSLQSENQGLKEKLIKSEASFNLLSETYTTLRDEYKKCQLKSYDNSNNNFILNKEYELIKKELDQKQKEIEFSYKEGQLWKIELEITKRENVQLQKDLEQMKKDFFNKQIENINLLRDIEGKKSKINTLEQELFDKKVVYKQKNQGNQNIINKMEKNDEWDFEQMKQAINSQRMEIENYNEELKQTRLKLLVLEEGENQKFELLDEIGKTNPQLQMEIQMLKQRLIESSQEIKQNSRILENEKLKSQINLYLQQPNEQNLDFTYLINKYSTLNDSLKQENQALIHQNKKDQVKLESLQKQLGINKRKNIIELSEQRQQSLEQEITQLEKAVLNGKQNMADVINAVLECGGTDLAEAVERFLIARRSTKIS
ncbi:unnamed protein product [Paramecium sonneborni]|uniref:Uncharacterized protein n=1 Tax=Paramecium sonneborni TaxID=65129 RepID=A0A8S1QQH3_9CILI|nr:unnamed protein product [Paramecium sonneborni]